MVERTGFVALKKEMDYAVFVIIENIGGLPLVQEKGNFPEKKWKLPGGRPLPEDKGVEEITAMREVFDEVGIIVEYPEKEILRIPKPRHDFIVLTAEYYSGELTAKAEIERVKCFIPDEIRQMIEENKILPDHAKALNIYLYGE